MSVFSVAVIILAILAALLVTRQGQKITGLMALGFPAFGASSEWEADFLLSGHMEAFLRTGALRESTQCPL
jgi:hypothetical protein